MSTLYLDPKGFQGQIDSLQANADTVKELKYELESSGISLQSVDRYLECVQEMNETLALFSELLSKDVQSMKNIKAKWMHTDTTIGTKTLYEIISGVLGGNNG